MENQQFQVFQHESDTNITKARGNNEETTIIRLTSIQRCNQIEWLVPENFLKAQGYGFGRTTFWVPKHTHSNCTIEVLPTKKAKVVKPKQQHMQQPRRIQQRWVLVSILQAQVFYNKNTILWLPKTRTNLLRNDLVPFLNGTPKTSRSSRTKSKTSSIQRKKPRLQWRKKTNEPQISSTTTEQIGEVQMLQSLLTPMQKAMPSKPTQEQNGELVSTIMTSQPIDSSKLFQASTSKIFNKDTHF